MRNQNYYRSVVKEFFPKEIDKFRDAIVAQSQITGDSKHECFCNMCGDDISSRASDLAEHNFKQFKETFL